MATAPLPRADEADTAQAPVRVAARELPVAVDPWTPMAIETDTASGGTTVAVAPLPTAVEVDACDADVAGTTSYITVPGTGFGVGPFGTSPFGGGEASTLVPITVSRTPLAVGRLATAAERNLGMPLTSLVDEGEYGAAIEAIDRVPIYSLKADWNRNGLYDHVLSDLTDLVEEVQVGRALSGTLPVEVGLVEGYSSAELTVKLSGRWRKPPDSYIDRINLALNPSVEVSAAGYTVVYTGTLSPLAVLRNNGAPAAAGQYYIYARPVDDGTAGFVFIRCPLVRVTVGQTYTFSAHRHMLGTVGSVYVGVDWMDGNGNQLFGTTVNGPQITGAGWARGSVTATAPDGAVYARQFLVAGTTSFANYVRWDAILVEAGGQLGDYFDGDTSGASWDGVAHASTSRVLAEANADYEDSAADLVDVFGPYRSDSPLYGKPVLKTPIYLETGMIAEDGPRLTRKFTGVVTQIHPQSAARTVELRAVDQVALLRASVTVSGAGMYDAILTRVGPDAYRSRLNSQWLIDHALRRNGIYTSPPARDDAILSVTGHGSMLPEVGWGGAPEEYYVTYRGEVWQPGKFGGALATVGGPIGRWWLTDQVTAAAGTGFGFSMWMGMYPGSGTSREMFAMDLTTDASWFLRFGINANGVPYVGLDHVGGAGVAFLDPAAGGYTAPSSAQWQFVGVHLSFTATVMTAVFRINGVTYTRTASIGDRGGNWKPGLYMKYTWTWPFTNFQLWKSTTPPANGWTGEDPNWIPQAFLDPGNNELTAVPELIGQDSWELIKAVADAEGSTFQFDEYGKPWFRTSKGDEYYGRRVDPPEVISADRNLADLVAVTDESTVRNVINIKTKSQLIGDWGDYYTSPSIDAFDVEAFSTTYFEIDLPVAAYEIPPPLSTNGSLTHPGAYRYQGGDGFVYYGLNSDWQAFAKQRDVAMFIRCFPRQKADPTQWVIRDVQIRVVRLTPWKMQIIIRNGNNYAVQFATLQERDATTGQVTNDGEPALIIPARLVKEGPEQLETWTDNASVITYGATTFDVGGSNDKWRQRPEGLRSLASEVLATTANPVPVLDAVDGVPHDPRRKVGDRVLLRDPQGLGEVLGTIAELTTTYSHDGASDQITVRPLAPPGLGLLDDPTHGLLDASLVLGP
jgi:hypothetical protein